MEKAVCHGGTEGSHGVCLVSPGQSAFSFWHHTTDTTVSYKLSTGDMPSPSTQDLQHTACNRDTTEKLRLGRVDSRSGGQVYWGAMRGMPPEVARTRSQVLQWLPHSSAEGLFSSIPFPSRDSQEAQGKQHERSLCPRWHQHPLTLGHIPSQTSQASGCKGLVAQSLEEWV